LQKVQRYLVEQGPEQKHDGTENEQGRTGAKECWTPAAHHTDRKYDREGLDDLDQ
jgi:hypothetical protein